LLAEHPKAHIKGIAVKWARGVVLLITKLDLIDKGSYT
jgi:hypothetical protein